MFWRKICLLNKYFGKWAELILQPFRHFTYVTTHSPTLPSLYLHHSSFSNPSVASPTSQFILQPFFRSSYVTSSSLNSPGEPPMLSGLKLSDIRLIGEEKTPKKTSPRKSVPTGNKTLARCLTGAHATACCAAVDN